jgi:ABC-2 type transport system ATP-binding protein
MPSSSETVLKTTNLVKTFGTRQALTGLDLEIRAGENFGLIGPNGAGKTTLMRLLVGLLRPTSGSVEVLGLKPPHPSIKSAIGYMTQGEALYPDLACQENLEFFASLYGVSREKARSRIDELLELVELTNRRESLARELSGGMKRRLSLASSLIHEPRILLLDEPTAGVDPELRLAFWEHFQELKRKGVTLLITTHHLDEAVRCDRLGLIRNGSLIACGKPKELLTRAGCATLEEAFLKFASGRVPGE